MKITKMWINNYTIIILYFFNIDVTKKIRFPMLLDMILFDSVISKIYIQTRPGRTSEDNSK